MNTYFLTVEEVSGSSVVVNNDQLIDSLGKLANFLEGTKFEKRVETHFAGMHYLTIKLDTLKEVAEFTALFKPDYTVVLSSSHGRLSCTRLGGYPVLTVERKED